MGDTGSAIVASLLLFFAVVGIAATLVFFIGPPTPSDVDHLHATLEARCVEGEVYSRDLAECVVPRRGR